MGDNIEAIINGDERNTINPVISITPGDGCITIWNGHYDYDISLSEGPVTIMLRVRTTDHV